MLLFETEVQPKKSKKKESKTAIIGDKTNLIIETYKDDFLNYCQKLKKSGCNSADKDWWRYRFYEFLKCDEDSKGQEVWEEKTNKYHTWESFWSQNWKEIDERWHSLCITDTEAEDSLDADFDY